MVDAQIFPSTNPPGNAAGNPDAILSITTESPAGLADPNYFEVSSSELCISGDGKNQIGVGDDPEWRFDIAIPPGSLPTCADASITICRRGDFGQNPEIVFIYDENFKQIGVIPGHPSNSTQFDCTLDPICTTISLSPCEINEQGANGIFQLTLYTNGNISGNTVGDFCDLEPGPQGGFQNQNNGGPLINTTCSGCNCAFLDAFSFDIDIADPGFTADATVGCVGDPIGFLSNPNSSACGQSFTVDGQALNGATWTPTSAGSYTICSTAGPSACPIQECIDIVVEDPPAAPPTTLQVCPVNNFNPYDYSATLNPSGEGTLYIFIDNTCGSVIEDDTQFDMSQGTFPVLAVEGGNSGSPILDNICDDGSTPNYSTPASNLGTCSPPATIDNETSCTYFGGTWTPNVFNGIDLSDDDVRLDEGEPDNNGSGLSFIDLDGEFGDREYMAVHYGAVSTLPASAIITQAELSFYIEDGPSNGDYDFNVHTINTAWDANAATWNTLNGAFDPTAIGAFQIPVFTNGIFEIDITNTVQSWVDGSATNNGLMFIPQSTFDDDVVFGATAAGAAFQSRLIITYEVGGSCAGGAPVTDTDFTSCSDAGGTFAPNNVGDQMAQTVKYAIVSDNGCVSEGEITWDVSGIDATIFAVSQSCHDDNVVFSVAPGGAQYDFSLNGTLVQSSSSNTLTLNTTTDMPNGVSIVSVKVNDPNYPCSGEDFHEIEVYPQILPVDHQLILCDDDNITNNDNADGIATFDLSTADATIMDGIAGAAITYHINSGDAVLGINALGSSFDNFSNPQVLFARVTSDATACHGIAELTLTVEDPPEPDAGLDFNLCAGEAVILGGAIAGTSMATWSITGAPNGGDGVLSNTTATASPQSVTFTATQSGTYILTLTTEPTGTSCGVETRERAIVVTPNPAAANVSIESCDGSNTVNNSAEFDLRNIESTITGGTAGVTVSFHSTLIDAQALSNQLEDTIQSVSLSVFARVSNDITECFSTSEITLIVLDDPETTDPIGSDICAGTDASFSTNTSQGTAGYTYKWYESTDMGVSYALLVTSAIYVGADTKDLTVTGVTIAQNNYYYRLVVTDSNGCSDTSAFAILQVTDCAPSLTLTKSTPVITDPSISGVAGNVDAEYTFVICNTSIVALKNISLLDDFDNEFGSGFVSVIGDPVVSDGLNADVTTTNPTANINYSGSATETDMLNADGRLAPNECVTVVVNVEINLSEMPSPSENQARTDGYNDLDQKGTDLSDDISDNTSNDDPTPFPNIPKIGLAKHVVSVTPSTTNGNYIIRYGYLIQNVGNVQLDNIELDDDIRTQFGANVMVGDASISDGVTGVANALGNINPSFTGGSGTDAVDEIDVTDILDATAILDPQDSLHIFLDVEVIVS